jgi:hypothetical protein
VHNYPTDLIKKFYIVLFLRARIVVYSIMVVVYMLKELKNKNFVFNIVKVPILALAILMMLSMQASACYYDNDGYIGDRVWNDLDKDGKQDWTKYNKEPGIPGVTVNLYKCDGTFVKSTTTDSYGKYWFKVDPCRKYYVEFVLPDGYVFTQKDKAHYTLDSDADTTTGETVCFYVGEYCTINTVDAGMYCQPAPEPAGVGNYVWNDMNVNGIQDDDESGMEGVTVKLYTCSGQLVDTKFTDENGYYEFTNLDAGDYYIQFVSPSGYVFTLAGQGDEDEDSDAENNGATSCFTLNAGDYYNEVDAGVYNREEIPEFPTVAIPMVAIMGLAFVFGRRKE